VPPRLEDEQRHVRRRHDEAQPDTARGRNGEQPAQGCRSQTTAAR
jgi:hypothetical protein